MTSFMKNLHAHFLTATLTLMLVTPAMSQETIISVGPGIEEERSSVEIMNRGISPVFRRSMATTSVIDNLLDPGATDDSSVSYMGDNLGNHSAAGNLAMNAHDLRGAGEVHSDFVFSFNYFYHSDERLKENIETLTPGDSTDLIRSVRPVRYTLKETGATSMGVIAQEIELFLPEIVNTNEEGFKSVDYLQLIAPMIVTIQSLEQRVVELESQLKAD